MRALVLLTAPLLHAQDAALDDAQVRRIEELFDRWEEPGSPGAAVGVVRAGRLSYARGFGLADVEQGIAFTPDTVTYVGSVAKQFTALAVHLLAEEGRIDLDADVRGLVPELPDYGAPITPRQLLHHAGGLRDVLIVARWAGYRAGDLLTREEALGLLFRQSGVNFPAGTRFEYSNSGYLLLALAVERALDSRSSGGSDFGTFVGERILEPLGMSSSRMLEDPRELVPRRALGYARGERGGFRHAADRWFKLGAGGLFTSVEDLARWVANFREPVVGTRAILERMQRPIAALDGTMGAEGAGLVPDSYRGVRVIHHAGNARGYGAEVLRFPDHDLAVIVVANTGARDLQPTSTALRVADVLLEGELDESEPVEAENTADSEGGVAETPLPPAEGIYARQEPREFFRLRSGADGLEGDYGGGSRFELAPVPGEPDLLAIAGTDERLRLVFEEGERPTAIEYLPRPGAAPSRFERVPELTREEAATLEGTFATPDLPLPWRISFAETGLEIRVGEKPWTLYEALDRIAPDVFTDGDDVFELRRDAAGEVELLAVTGPRVGTLELRRAR